MADLLGGQDIGALLSSSGPVVKCVLLRSTPSNDNADVKKQSTKDGPIQESESESETNGTSKKRKSDAISLATTPATTPSTEESQKIEQQPSAEKATASTNGVATSSDSTTGSGRRPYEPLVELMEELEVDTTPRKSMVAQVLGGPFTFLGQYEEEGIMVIVRRPTSREEVESLSINPHQLQPPLDQVQVYGDILLMRVAPTNEILDSDSEDDDDNDDNDKEEPNQDTSPETVLNNKENGYDQTGDPEEKKDTKEEATNSTEETAPEKIEVPTNDEFFLDYTKKEYIYFASRTDIIAPSIEEDEDGSDSDEEEEQEEEVEGDNDDDNEGEEGEDEDDEGDEDYDVEDESEDEDEDSSVGMMNLVLGQILKRFRMENGRGPDTRELLEIRMALAERLGVDVPPIDEDGSNWDRKAVKKKRKLIQEPSTTSTSTQPSSAPPPSSSNNVKSILCRKETMEDDEATGTTTPATTDTSSAASSLTGTRRVQFNGLEEDESSPSKENGSESNHGNEPEFGEI